MMAVELGEGLAQESSNAFEDCVDWRCFGLAGTNDGDEPHITI